MIHNRPRALLVFIIGAFGLAEVVPMSCQRFDTTTSRFSGEPVSFVANLSEWSEATGLDEQDASLRRFVQLALGVESDEKLRAYPLNEEQFSALDENERIQVQREYIDIDKMFARFAAFGIERARRWSQDGDRHRALRVLDALSRAARANDSADIVLIARLRAQGIQRMVDEVRQELGMALK